MSPPCMRIARWFSLDKGFYNDSYCMYGLLSAVVLLYANSKSSHSEPGLANVLILVVLICSYIM